MARSAINVAASGAETKFPPAWPRDEPSVRRMLSASDETSSTSSQCPCPASAERTSAASVDVTGERKLATGTTGTGPLETWDACADGKGFADELPSVAGRN